MTPEEKIAGANDLLSSPLAMLLLAEMERDAVAAGADASTTYLPAGRRKVFAPPAPRLAPAISLIHVVLRTR